MSTRIEHGRPFVVTTAPGVDVTRTANFPQNAGYRIVEGTLEIWDVDTTTHEPDGHGNTESTSYTLRRIYSPAAWAKVEFERRS